MVHEVDRHIDQWLSDRDLPSQLCEAIRYALHGGKRMRPIVALLSCEAVGGQRASALPAAGAIELVHCFSLIHDDLPAMDDDAMRRGRPTVHVRFGEALAILAGDAMISLAFEMTGGGSKGDATHGRVFTTELAAATTSMISGQVHDTFGDFPPDLDEADQLNQIHRNKTAALFRAAARMGGISGHADEAQLAGLTMFGENLGLMFQIVDDLLDVTQQAEHVGKATGKDKHAGKLTAPGVFGVEKARTEVQRLQTDAHRVLEPLGEPAGPLLALCDHMAVRSR